MVIFQAMKHSPRWCDSLKFRVTNAEWFVNSVLFHKTVFVLCNIYGYNSSVQAKNMSMEVSHSVSALMDKYQGAVLMMEGWGWGVDFNDAPDDLLDRLPPHTFSTSNFKLTTFLCNQLSLVEIWRFLNSNKKLYSWSNYSRSLQSRIDLRLINPVCEQYVSEVTYCHAPLSDHKMMLLTLVGCKLKNNSLRGYWKLNNKLLGNEGFINQVQVIAQQLFKDKHMSYIMKWELLYLNLKLGSLLFMLVNKLKVIIWTGNKSLWLN